MKKNGKIAVAIYAILMLVGGIGGYASKHSLPSLISGVVSALLLGVAFTMIGSQPKKGFGLSAGVAFVLALVFIERAVKTSAEASSLGRNIGLTVLSLAACGFFAMCSKSSAD